MMTRLEREYQQLRADCDYLTAHAVAAEVKGQSPEDALITATYALRAERGRDYRKKLLLSETVSRVKKDVIQAELLREGIDVQPWLDEVHEASVRFRRLSVEERVAVFRLLKLPWREPWAREV